MHLLRTAVAAVLLLGPTASFAGDPVPLSAPCPDCTVHIPETPKPKPPPPPPEPPPPEASSAR